MIRCFDLLFMCILSAVVLPQNGFCETRTLTDGDKAIAKQLFTEGGELFAAGQYLAAVTAFRDAATVDAGWHRILGVR